jgi:succinyl-diaminopimelate desuccinylase
MRADAQGPGAHDEGMTAAALDPVQLVSDLVARPTISGDAGPQRDVLGIVTELLRERAPHLESTSGQDPAQPWTLLRNPVDPDRPQLLFACHVDTVPVPDPGGWQRDPFGADLDGARVWGRGASDMKAGLAAAAAALAAADPETPVALLLTSDEEIGSKGAAAAAEAVAEQRIGAVVVPEATANQVVLGHRGALWLAVRTAGRAAHGSTPERGHNAILDLAGLLARAGGRLPLRTDSFLGTETWNPGVVSGGSVPNVVPDHAEAVIDMRTVGESAELLAWWRGQPEVAGVDVRVDLPPMSTPADDPWVATLPGPVLGTPATYFTDASVLVRVVRGAPVVVWGPGTPAVMHAVDEYVEVAELEQAVAAFGAVITAWPA